MPINLLKTVENSNPADDFNTFESLSSVEKTPEQYSKSVKLADRSELPVALVEGSEKETENDLRKKSALEWYKLENSSPVLFKSLKSARFAGQAHTDIPQLSAMEKLFYHGEQAVDSVKETADSIAHTLENTTETIPLGFKNVFDGVNLAGKEFDSNLKFAHGFEGSLSMADFSGKASRRDIEKRIGDDNALRISEAATLLEQITQRNETIDDLTPKDLTLFQQGVRGAVESLPQSLAALGLGIATGTGPAGAVGAMMTSSLGQSYGSARSKGLSQNEALLYGTAQALIEGATEMIPTGTLMDMYRRNPSFANGVFKFVKQEMGGEQLATLGQSLVDYVAGLDEELEAADISQWPEIQGKRQIVTAISTFFSAGAQVGIVKGASNIADRLLTEQQLQDRKNAQDQQYIDNIANTAEASVLKQNNSEDYKAFVKEASKDAEVLIDGSQAYLYLQGKDTKNDPVLASIAKNIDEANAVNGQVSIPVSDFAADVVGSEHYEALRPHMTMSEDAISPFRQASEKKAREDYTLSLIEDANKLGDTLRESKVIFDSTVDQLIASGQVSKRNSKIMAGIMPEWVAVKSNELGLSPEEVYKKVGLSIEGPATDGITPEQSLSQAVESGYKGNDNQEAKEWNAAVNDGLDMSNDARMARAKEMGFDVDAVYYHGSHDFGATIDLSNYGEGEGGQGFGYGFHVTATKDTANDYTYEIDGKEKRIYELYIPDSSFFLDWHLPLNRQSKEVITILKDASMFTNTSQTGEQLYYDVAKDTPDDGFDGDLEASDFFESIGIFGIQYTDNIALNYSAENTDPDKRDDDARVGGHINKTIFNPSQIRSINAAFNPSQKDSGNLLAQEDRGYYDPQNTLIRLNKASNTTTFTHEFAHFMLDMEFKMDGAQTGNINKWFARVSEDVIKEAGIVSQSDVDSFIDGSLEKGDKYNAINTATHEQFARGFEAYVMEGKAPSEALRQFFREIGRMMVSAYKYMQSGFNPPKIDDEMRQVFSRLIASEEQIELATANASYQSMFTSAAMAGMTEEKYKKYLANQKKQTSKATETLKDKLLKQITREYSKTWKDELNSIKAVKQGELEESDLYLMIERLKEKDWRLNRKDAKDILNIDKIPTQLHGMTDNKGSHPDDIAPVFRYQSGAEMLNAIIAAPTIAKASYQAAKTEMLAKHGDILNDGTLEKIAEDLAANDEHGTAILRDIKILSKNRNVPQIDRKTLKHMADVSVGKLSYSEIKPARYRSAEIRNAQLAFHALKNGDRGQALQYKTQQAMNFYLYRSAYDARVKTDKILSYAKSLTKKKTKERIAKAGFEYWEQIESILSRFQLSKSVSLKVHKQNMAAWLAERSEAMDDIIVSDEVMNESYAQHWREVPSDVMVGVYETLLSIQHNSKTQTDILIAGEKYTFDQAKEKALESMSRVKDKHIPKVTDIIDAGSKKLITDPAQQRSFLSDNTKIPWLTTWLDNNERVGVMHDLIMSRIDTALHDEMVMLKDISKPIIEAMNSRSDADKIRHSKLYHIKELNADFYGHQFLAIALNTGTESNLRKLLLGEQWAKDETEVNKDNKILNIFLDHMTESDWDLVELIWTQINKMYPDLSAVHQKISGLPLNKVEGVSFTLKSGRVVEGMYYPMHYDPLRSAKAQENADKQNEIAMSMMNPNGSVIPGTSTGARIERTGYVGPVALSLEVVPNHIQEVAHFITHYEAVKQTSRFIRDPDISKAITAKLGREEYAQLLPWLDRVAKSGRDGKSKLWLEKLADKMRFGVTLQIMGFKASTIIIQSAGIFNTMAEVGSMNVLHSYAKLGTAPIYRAIRGIFSSEENTNAHVQYAMKHSKALPHRLQTYDREVANATHDITSKDNTAFRKIQALSMAPIGAVQFYTVDLPSWYAAREKGLKEYNGDVKRSHKYADWVVENIQGSGAIKDMSQLMATKSPYLKLMTMFMTFFSAAFNANRDVARQYKAQQITTVEASQKLLLMWLLPAIFEELARHGFGDDDDDETFAEKVLTQAALTPLAANPATRMMASAFNDYRTTSSPVLSTIEKGIDNVGGEHISLGRIKSVSKLVAAYYGVPGVNQLWLTGEHLGDAVLDGEEITLRQLAYGRKR